MRRGIRGFVQIKCNTIILIHDCLISHDIFANPVTSADASKNPVVMESKTTSDGRNCHLSLLSIKSKRRLHIMEALWKA